jgi:hypothetical protein
MMRIVFLPAAKRHFLTRSVGKHITSRGCLFCKKNDLVLVTADGRVQETNTSLEGRSCTASNLAGEAGLGKGTARRGVQKDKHAAPNIRRGGIVETKGKKRPYDLRTAKCSL